MMKKAKAIPCSHVEYESLPETVVRKYLSPLERLRIAEEQALHERQAEHKSARRPSRARSFAIHRRLRRAESLRHDQLPLQHQHLTRVDASFFQSLPPKVQRTAFSPEEQTALGRLPQHDEQRLHAFSFGFETPTPTQRGCSRRHRSGVSSADISPTRSPNAAEELDPDAMRPLASQSSRASFRRTLSLTNIPLRSSTSSAPLPPEPFSAQGPASWHQRAHSHSISGHRSSHTSVSPVFDPEATHYQDPEARKKLRMFLASPQKFDEAVEFGFPSTSGDDTMPPRYHLPPISTDARNFSRDMQTFLKDDRMSFLEWSDDENKGLDSDTDSMADFDSPVTPSSVGLSFRYQPRKHSSNFSSMDSTGVPLFQQVTGRLNREMTLRMTLTRPDLRAEDDQLYGWQGQEKGQAQKDLKDDPFALEDLPLSDDMNGTKGPFYVKPKPPGNLVSRLFKRASKKGR